MIPSVIGLAAFSFTEGWRYCEYEEWIVHTWVELSGMEKRKGNGIGWIGRISWVGWLGWNGVCYGSPFTFVHIRHPLYSTMIE